MNQLIRLRNAFFILFLLPLFCQAQNLQNNQWRFGGAGAIDFNTTPPSFVTGCAIQTFEGSASVADKVTGALLFYTDGVTVWNANNQVMSNGTGLLGGTAALLSSTTAAVIVPKPGSNSLFYIVTIDEQFNGNGVRYSVVDMTLNGGLGDIVAGQKNIFLFQTNSEKLEVVPASDALSYWLITHDNPGNTFFSFKIDNSGIQTIPVISQIGGTHGNGAGHMKVNKQYNKIAIGLLNVGAGSTTQIELFDFNNTTGVLSNAMTWNYTIQVALIYGVEFSPNGEVLYVSDLQNLVQYDITQPTPLAIQNSLYQVAAGANASLQLGKDEKIYVNSGSLNVINCPNKLGAACGYQTNVIANQTGGGGYGLPKWVYYADDAPISTYQTIIFNENCFGAITQFFIADTNGISSITWNFGDPNSGANNTSTSFNTSHIFSQIGYYNVQAIIGNACGFDTLFLDSLAIVNPCNPLINQCDVYQYTGAVQQWTVPSGVDTLRIKMWGAAGGGGSDPTNNAGGGGGFSELVVAVIPGQVLDITVGGGGKRAIGGVGGIGGWPNGGNGGSGNRPDGGGGGGGGRSEVAIAGITYGIAGGGGGGAYNRSGGGGGGTVAEFTSANNTFNLNGFGGTQISGGAASSNTICTHPVSGTAGSSIQGGTGATDLGGGINDRTGGGGGGDGYYGGGGGGSHDGCFGVGSTGGGGSGYICTSCVGVTGSMITAGFFGAVANASDPVLASYPGIATGIDNQNGGDGLVYICFDNCTSTSSTISVTSCGSYTTPSGNVLTTSGTYIYTDTIPNAVSCDSIITINLTINPVFNVPPQTISSCNTYASPWGTVYTQSGTYSNVYTTTNGCDSIVTINLTINNSITTAPQTVSACNSYTAAWGTNYTQSGTYSNVYTTTNGCDSIVTINLTIKNSITTAPQTVTSCNTYTAAWGAVYTQSGTYSNNYTATNGCDSIVTINLTINNSITNPFQTVSSCNTYASPWGTVYTQSGTYSNTYTTINGCDSIVTINLTINNSITNPVQTVSACNTYTAAWGTVYTQSGTYSNIYTTINGCDSVVSVNLTINNAPVIALTATPDTCGRQSGTATATVTGTNFLYSYSWSNGSTANSISNVVSGNYTVTITDNNGCTTTNQITIAAIPSPTLITPFSPQSINQGESVSLSVSGASTYSWSPATGLSCTTCADPIASPISSTTYVVTGTDVNGCTATASITVLIDYDCTELFVPTIFSPNGNGPEKNESVCVYSNCIQEMEFAIYNRWGQQIFITNNPQQCWDGTSAGKELATGVYTYRLYVKQLDGIIVSKSGNITLVK
jgi:gliding motility-associated-like protein